MLNKADLAAPDKQQVGSITLLHVTLLHALHACAMTTRYASVLALTVVCFLKRLHAFQLRCASDAGCFAPVTGAAAVSPVHQQSEAWQHPTAVAHHHPRAESGQTQCRHAHDHGCRYAGAACRHICRYCYKLEYQLLLRPVHLPRLVGYHICAPYTYSLVIQHLSRLPVNTSCEPANAPSQEDLVHV